MPAVRGQGPTVAVVALGGVLGSLARWGIHVRLPTPAGGFPWATFGPNVLGSALMGVLVVVVTEVYTPHPLVRPFLGVGVLGGFTTFSTFAVESEALLLGGHRAVAFAYLGATIVAAVSGAAAGMAITRRLVASAAASRGAR